MPDVSKRELADEQQENGICQQAQQKQTQMNLRDGLL
jgi:hypothetical protein